VACRAANQLAINFIAGFTGDSYNHPVPNGPASNLTRFKRLIGDLLRLGGNPTRIVTFKVSFCRRQSGRDAV
jgi:hypothetical protein